MKTLTKTEEGIMNIVWKLGKCFVKEILVELLEPKPPYTTVSSVVRILERKGFVAHKAYGNTHQYYPKVEKDDYKKMVSSQLVSRFFDNSPNQLVSFFVEEQQMNHEEIEELIELLNKIKSR